MRVNSYSQLIVAVCLCVTAAVPAVAGPAVTHPQSASPKKNAAAPKFIPNSAHETTRERERRLLRECKGRPNAGACSGYAS